MTTTMSRSASRRQVFAILGEAGLQARDDRLMLASSILGFDVDSFEKMPERDLRDLAVALADWRRVEAARSATGAMTKHALEHLLSLDLPERLRAEILTFCSLSGYAFRPAGQAEVKYINDEEEFQHGPSGN